MGLIIYGNRNIDVVKEADKFIATEKFLQISAEGKDVTDAIKALKKMIRDKSRKNTAGART